MAYGPGRQDRHDQGHVRRSPGRSWPSRWCSARCSCPASFVPGVTGQFFRQFALTISAAMVISAVNAMTLTPSRAVAIFENQKLDEHGHPRHEALPWWIFAVLGGAAIGLGGASIILPRSWGSPATARKRMAAVLAGLLRAAGAGRDRRRSGSAGGHHPAGQRRAGLVLPRLQPAVRPLTDVYGRRVGRLVRAQRHGARGLRRAAGSDRLDDGVARRTASSPSRTRATCWSTCSCPTRPPSSGPRK